MSRLLAEADTTRWVPVTDSFGPRGRRARKKAITMLIEQATGGSGKGRGFAAWAVSQAAPALMRKAAGRVLVWVWKDDPELVVAVASIQEATTQLRAARAMRPMEYDDTESFGHPTLGVGEKLALTEPGRSPSVSYTFDLGTQLVELTALGGDGARFGTIMPDLDALARELRVIDDVASGETPGVLRLPPA